MTEKIETIGRNIKGISKYFFAQYPLLNVFHKKNATKGILLEKKIILYQYSHE